MRLMFVITKAERGGAQSHLLELVKGLAPAHRIRLVCGDDGPLLADAAALGADGIVVRELVHPISPRRDIAAVRSVRRAIAAFSPDLVHAHSSKAGVVARLAAKLAEVPSVFTAHGWAFAEGTPALRKMVALATEKACAGLSSAIIVVSDYDRRLALRFRIADDQKMVVIHNGISPVEPPARAAGLATNEITVVMTARFAAPKDPMLLLRALPMLPPYVRLKFIGAGPARASCERAAVSLGVSARVSFLGDRSDVAEQLAEADVFALCSQHEGLPISIIEAMRAGLPVVASNVGGIPELVLDGQTGFLVPRGSVDVLARRLQELVASPDLRRRLGQNGRARYEHQFSSQAMLRRTSELYESVLGRANAVRPYAARAALQNGGPLWTRKRRPPA